MSGALIHEREGNIYREAQTDIYRDTEIKRDKKQRYIDRDRDRDRQGMRHKEIEMSERKGESERPMLADI